MSIVPRCNARQMNFGLLLLACRNSINTVIKEIPERVDAAGIRDILDKMVEELDDCNDRIIKTFPPEKQGTIYNLRGELMLELTSKHNITSVGTTSVRTDVFDTLVQYAHENCKICVKPDKCGTCKLGRALDKCTPEERGNGESWADIWI